jgi:hypothetical protein
MFSKRSAGQERISDVVLYAKVNWIIGADGNARRRFGLK